MKNLKQILFVAGLTGGLIAASCLAADAPATDAPAESADTNKTDVADEAPQPTAAAPAPADVPAAMSASGTNAVPEITPDGMIRMKFRGAPLEMVLDYMSTAAGYIIHPKTEIRGNVTAWSNQPLTKDEALLLLKQVLSENGYTAISEGRTLTIVKSEDAKHSNIPVYLGNNPAEIPETTDVVTQIIPVRSLNAVQLPKDLSMLLPSDTTLVANESGNSLVMTDTQANIHRIAEIVKALDSVSAGINTIRVFPLKYADAKALVTTLKDLFPAPDANTRGGGGGFGRFGRGGGGFNPFGGGGGGGGNDTGNGHTPSTRVSATSDDHSNSLIVSAPEDLMPTIEELVKSVDSSVEASTVVQVFHLKNADPTEMADLLTSLFPDDTGATGSGQVATPFFGRFGGGGGGRQGNNSNESDRMKKLGHVISVADRRTASLVVTAAKDLMPQIEELVKELDSSTAKKQKVWVYDLKNADPMDAQQVLQGLFQTSSSTRNSGLSSGQALNPLTTRANQQLQQGTSTSAFGSGFGNSSSGRSSTP